MVPNSAAMLAPAKPVSTMAETSGPSSRPTAMAMMSATLLAAPYCLRIGAICNARIAPMQNRTRQTMGMLRTPTRFICAQRLSQPSRRPCLSKSDRRTPAAASPMR